MKKYLIYLCMASVLGLTSCEDFNDKHFEGLDDMSEPQNVLNKDYTLTAEDYSAISGYKEEDIMTFLTGDEATKKEKAEKIVTAIKAAKSNQYLTPEAEPRIILPLFMSKNWKTASLGATIRASYNYVPTAPAYLAELAAAGTYELTAADYATVWGEEGIGYLTPSKNPEKNIPALLASAFDKAKEGDLILASYQYSDSEPSGDEPEAPVEDFFADFEQVTPNADVVLDGWVNFTEKGTKRTWQGKEYSGNRYIQFSANGSKEDENVAWLISPGIDLSVYTAPVFTFNMKVGYYNANCLQILVSEDFTSDPTTATWKDITSNFSLPQGPTGGYAADWSIAGLADMSGYEGKVYIAFKYTGSGNNGKTTTYQIDNMFVGDQAPVSKTVVMNEKFDEVTPNADVALPEWVNFTEKGTKRTWQGKEFGGNKYVQFSANGSNEDENVAWLISPLLTVNAGENTLFSFDLKIGYYNADCLQVLVSEEFTGDPTQAKWTDISSYFTMPKEPTTGYGSDFSLAGTVDLGAFGGNVRVAFKYTGSGTGGKTTTYQIDNVKVTVLSAVATTVASPAKTGGAETRLAIYAYDGKAWAARKKTEVVNPADYQAMGAPGTHNNFSSSIPAENYLPQFLGLKYPYAQSADTVAVLYNFYDGETTALKADEYVFTAGAWTCNTQPVTVVTEQYALSEDGWKYSPDVTITLVPGRNAETSYYFQKLTDWVWENIDQKAGITDKGKGYVTSYGNNDYYYGGSAYQNNFDFRPAKWKEQMNSAYGTMSDEDLTALMWERLPEAMQHMLECNYPEVELEDVPITYVVNFGIYGIEGSGATKYYTIRFKLAGKGEFTYVEDSLKEIPSL